jgi:hypothetical protein
MKKTFLILLLSIFIAVISHAQEGMWLMNQLGPLNLQQKGIQLQDNEIYNPDKQALYNAIVQIGGGTGSFV